MEKEVKKMASFKLSPDSIEKLETLSKLFGQSKSEIVNDLIFSAYDKVNNNEDTKEMLMKLAHIQDLLKDFQK